MRKLADLHTHTPLCGHAAGEPEAYAAQAVAAGLSVYGAGDHFPLPPGYPLYDSMRTEQFVPEYLNGWLPRLRAVLEPAGIEVLCGTEFDYLPGDMGESRPLMDSFDLDYRISSVHFIDTLAVDHSPDGELWKKYSADWIWKRYVELTAQMVDEGGFEIIGHIDLAKKFGCRPPDGKAYLLAVHDILKTAASKGICMEINTAGLRKPVKEIYPAPEIVKAAFDAGVKITFGSDSHSPAEPGRDFDLAVELAQSAGYRSACFFRGKRPVELPFD